MSQILLIRHAETDLRGTFCGHTDPPLNDCGCSQLQMLTASLKRYDVASVYSSGLRRADATAQAIASHFEAPLYRDSNLREIHFGAWEALTWQQVEQRDRSYARRWVDDYPNLPAPNGESFEAFRMRVLSATAAIAATPCAGDIAIVTHAGVIQLLLTAMCGRTAQQAYEQTRDYCSIVPFQPISVVQHA